MLSFCENIFRPCPPFASFCNRPLKDPCPPRSSALCPQFRKDIFKTLSYCRASHSFCKDFCKTCPSLSLQPQFLTLSDSEVLQPSFCKDSLRHLSHCAAATRFSFLVKTIFKTLSYCRAVHSFVDIFKTLSSCRAATVSAETSLDPVLLSCDHSFCKESLDPVLLSCSHSFCKDIFKTLSSCRAASFLHSFCKDIFKTLSYCRAATVSPQFSCKDIFKTLSTVLPATFSVKNIFKTLSYCRAATVSPQFLHSFCKDIFKTLSYCRAAQFLHSFCKDIFKTRPTVVQPQFCKDILSKKPPPLHTGADWKVVLHLPEIETWLRATSDRVTQLSHSAGQDSDNRHVDVHLVQLKDICEDISDHVEQIHALLETEFSLKLLSYSVNIIVDIRTVQLLWHQLRVSVLVLKERLLQGLQDSNGNYTRQTDILQAFSQDQQQTRLDALTEVDDCGQLTIRCSQDYFSLDCGITAYELTDYSPGDEPEARGSDPEGEDYDPSQPLDPAQGPNPEPPGAGEGHESCFSNHGHHNSLPDLDPPANSSNHNRSPPTLPTMQCGNHGESAKRPLQGASHSAEVSPTQPSLPKRAALFSDGGTGVEDSRGGLGNGGPLSGLQFQAELSRSTPSLVDPPDRTKFWLELDSVYPENVSQSCESLQVMNGRNPQRNRVRSRQLGRSQGGEVPRPPTEPRGSSEARPPANAPPPPQNPGSREEKSQQMERTQRETHAHSEGDSDSSLPSPVREQLLSSDLDASGEESDPRPHPGKTAVWIVKRQGQKGAQFSSRSSPDREHWFGSEEFMALPDQLRQTEMLATKLGRLAQSIPLMPDGRDSTQKALQNVDDWDLTELNPDWEAGESDERESGDDMPSLLPPLLPYRRNLVSRFSSTSSSDVALSLDESIESGPLSDLQSEEDEGRRSAERRLRRTAPPVAMRGGASLVHQLLEDIRESQNQDPAIWKKLECFVATVGRVHLLAAGGAGQHRQLDAAQTGPGQPEGVPGHTPEFQAKRGRPQRSEGECHGRRQSSAHSNPLPPIRSEGYPPHGFQPMGSAPAADPAPAWLDAPRPPLHPGPPPLRRPIAAALRGPVGQSAVSVPIRRPRDLRPPCSREISVAHVCTTSERIRIKSDTDLPSMQRAPIAGDRFCADLDHLQRRPSSQTDDPRADHAKTPPTPHPTPRHLASSTSTVRQDVQTCFEYEPPTRQPLRRPPKRERFDGETEDQGGAVHEGSRGVHEA
ncbi:A-kinase anchor protein 6 [Etheostoma spectabile]|uniref:A-kinase anchor protein 6 n=1 Tax=Etheostoma spectabile TaxID=54343 RepID=UPI0013AEC4A2|nr:A-kinase anchor protein 6 [Etheostoma spectabile]